MGEGIPLVSSLSTMALNIYLILTVLVIAAESRERKRPPGPQCMNGEKYACYCSDGSKADLSKHPCETGEIDYEDGCLCPPGYDTVPIPGLSHGFGAICKNS